MDIDQKFSNHDDLIMSKITPRQKGKFDCVKHLCVIPDKLIII